MSVPAWDVATDPLGKVLQPNTNDEMPTTAIDVDSVQHDASILSTKVIFEDSTNAVATTAGHTMQLEEHFTAVLQPVTSSPEENGLNAIENNSLPELDIEIINGGVPIEDTPFAEAGHEPCDIVDQQSIQLLGAEMTKTAVSAEIPVCSDIGLPVALEKEMSEVSNIEAFTITEVKDIDVHQDSNVFASGNDNGDIHTYVEESNQDTTVDSSPIGNPAETAIEIVNEASNTGSGADIMHESGVFPIAAPELKLGKGNTTNEEFASKKNQDITDVAEVEHAFVVPKSDIEKDTTVEMETNKGEILLSSIGQEVVVPAASSLIGDEALLSKPPSETAEPAMAPEVEKAPNVADTTQVSELETPARVYDLADFETTPIDTSRSKALAKVIPAPKIDPTAVPAADVAETHDIVAKGWKISSELVVAPLADVQDVPLEAVSQAVDKEQLAHGSDSGLEVTLLRLEDNMLDNALEGEIPPAETLVDVETLFSREGKPVISDTFEEVEIVKGVSTPETAEELVQVSQDPKVTSISNEHVIEEFSPAETLPVAANELDSATMRDILVDPHAIAEVPQATVTASEEVAAEPLENEVTSVLVAEPSEDKKVVLVEEISVNTQLDNEVVVVDTSANEIEAGDPDGPKLGGLANENANSQADLEIIQASRDDVDVKHFLHDENSTQVGEEPGPPETISDSEPPEPTAPADAVVASITAVLTDEGISKVTEHDEDAAEPTQALLAGEPEAETMNLTMSQSLANEFAIDAEVFTVSDPSDVQAKTSATAPVREGVAGGLDVATQNSQEEPEATVVVEEQTVGPEAEAQATERPSIDPNYSLTSEIGESPTHLQTSADQAVDEMSKHSLDDGFPKGMEHSKEAATKIVVPEVIPLVEPSAEDERIKGTITEANAQQEVSVMSQPAPVAGKDEEAETVTVTKSTPTPLSLEATAVDKGPEPAAPINDQVEEVAASGPAIKCAPVIEEVAKTREVLVVLELPNEESAIPTTKKAVKANVEVGEQLGSQVLPFKEESPAVEVRVLSVDQQNPIPSAEQADSVSLVPLRGQITPADPSGSDSVESEERQSLNDPQIESFPIFPCTVQDKIPVVLPIHSPDLTVPNLQGSEEQVPTAHTLSAKDEITNGSPQPVEKVVTHPVGVEEASVLQYPDSVVEVHVSGDLAVARVPQVQIAADAIVEPPTTEKVEPSILSIEQKDPDLAPNAADSELLSSADGQHPQRAGVTRIERPNSPYAPTFLVTMIGHGLIPDEPSASEMTGLILSPLDECAIIAPEEILTTPVIQIDSSVILQADEAPMDGSQLPARPWTPSYSVHSQGSPLVTAKELDNGESDVLVDDANSTDPNEPELEEMRFAKNTEPEVLADSPSDELQILKGSPQPQNDRVEETRDLPCAVNSVEKGSNQVAKEEVSTSEITLNEQWELQSEMETIKDIPTVVTEDSTTEEVSNVKLTDQLEERSQSSPWIPSYSVSTQGSPLPETRELDVIIEARPSVLPIYEPITSQNCSVSVPPIGAESLIDGAHVQNESLGSEQRLDEPTAHNQLPDIPIAVSIPSVNAQDSQKDTWTPSYSVTTQGVAHLSQEEVATLNVSFGSSPAAIASLGEALHDSSEPPPETTSDASNNVPAIVEEQSNSDALQRDFERPAILQSTLPERHQSELVPEPRLLSAGDATPKQTAVVPNEHTAAKIETPLDGVSDHIFPSADDTQPESTPDSKAKPVVPRLVPLEEYSNDTLSPEPSSRKRLESTTSSRFFPGGWFSSNSTKSPDESRPSLELAQGEFIPAKSLADGTEAIVSAISSTTTESFGDSREADSASSEEKRKWCIIM